MNLLRVLDPEQQKIVSKVGRLAKEKFARRAARYDDEASFPMENYEELRDAGLLALNIPKAYGGLGADTLTFVLSLFEMAKGCPATALTFNMHSNVLALLVAMGTEEQRIRYCEKVVDGGSLISSVTSEPGSSFRNKMVIKTTFTPDDDGYQVKGTKHFCSSGGEADYYFVTGVLDDMAEDAGEIVCALVHRDTPGLHVEKTWNATGMRATASHTLNFDVFVNDSEVIGEPGQFMTIGTAGFALGYAATYLAIGEAALDVIVDLAKSTSSGASATQFHESPVSLKIIGEVATAIRSAKLMLVDAAAIKNEGDHQATMLAANQAKYLGAEVGMMATQSAIRLVGGRGVLKELPLERFHRDALVGLVMPPANDRCLQTIGRLICGLDAATLEIVPGG